MAVLDPFGTLSRAEPWPPIDCCVDLPAGILTPRTMSTEEGPDVPTDVCEPSCTVFAMLPIAWSQGAAVAIVQTPPSRPAVAAPAASRETLECFRARRVVVSYREDVDMRELLLIRGNKS